ncbi:MAG: MFS transporter [Chloroflexi bacterium]|nr:MFS transporter [Chloroflexota bacterium]
MNLSGLRRLPARMRPGDSEEERNYWYLYAEVACFGFMFGILQTFLSVYALRLGATNDVMGWLAAVPSLVFALWSIPAAGIIERATHRLRFIVTNGALYRTGLLALALVPIAFSANRAEAIVVVVTLMSFPQVMSNISFSAMFADVVPSPHRTRVVAVRNVLLGLTSTLGSLLGGLFLGLNPAMLDGVIGSLFTFPLNYQVLFATGYFASMFSILFLSRLRTHDERVVMPVKRNSLLSPRGFIDLMRRGPQFSRFALAMFILHWGIFLPVPLYTIYWVRHLNASDTFIGIILTVQSLTSMIMYAILPRLSVRLGDRRLLLLAVALNAAYPLATAFTTTLEPLLLISIVGGLSNAMFGLSSFNLLLDVAPAEQRPSYIAVFNSALFSAGFIAPFIGTALLNVISINADMLIAAGLRFSGLIALLLLVGASGKQSSVKV